MLYVDQEIEVLETTGLNHCSEWWSHWIHDHSVRHDQPSLQ